MRTHVRLYVVSTVAVGDTFRLGLIVGRANDVGTPAPAGAVDPSQTELDWMFWRREVAAPVYDPNGSNIIELDLRAKRKLEELNQVYIVSINNLGPTTPLLVRCVARTLVALP